MARLVTSGEQAVLEGAHYATHLKVTVEDADGVYQDVTDRVVSGRLAQTVDQIVATAEVDFQMEERGGNSLAPLDETSGLNVDSGAAYAPLLDVGRGVRVYFATIANSATVTSGDWQHVFDGVMDEWDATKTPLTIRCRDAIGAEIADRWVEEEVELGSADGVAIETVMQEILTANTSGPITLYTPTSPGFLIKPYRQQRMSVLDALQQLAALIGWVVEPRWDDGTGAFRLTFYEPDREPVATDWVWGPSRYSVVNRFRLSRLNVRNALSLWYTDASGVRQQYTVEDATSIAKYGRQWMEIEEDEESSITTEAEAQGLGDNLILDLKDPVAEKEIKTFCFWPVQLGDNHGFTANGVHYSEDQEFGITGWRHEWAGGHISTFLQTRGKPAGFTTPWLKRGGKRRDPTEELNGLRLSVRVLYDTPTTGQVTVKITRGSSVFDVGYYLTSLQQPIEDADKPWPEDGDLPDGVLPRGTDSLVVDAPASDFVTFLQLEPRDASGKAGNPVRVEIHPKAVSTGADLPPGSVIAEALVASAQSWGFDGTWGASASNVGTWGSGTLTLADGTTYSINSGSATGLGAATAPTFIYFDAGVSSTDFQTTTDWGAAIGDGAVLIAVAWAGGVLANVVPGAGVVGLDGNAIRSESIQTNNLAANAVTAPKASFVTLSSLSADLGTVTAGTIEASVTIKATTFSAANATYTGNLFVNGDTQLKSLVRFRTGGAVQVEDGRIVEWYDTGNTFRGDLRATTSGMLMRASTLTLLDANTDEFGMWGVTPVAQPSAYTPSNVTTTRSFDADSTTLAEVADVLGTLIADIQSWGGVG